MNLSEIPLPNEYSNMGVKEKQQKIPLGIGDIMMVLEDLNTVAGLYFTGQVKNRVVFDTEALVSITNDVAVFIYWD